MELQERKEMLALEKDLDLWARRYSSERLRYSKAKTEIGIHLAANPQIKDSLSFENKCVELMKTGNPVYKKLYEDYIGGYNKYKSAYIIWQTVEHKINNYKFINRIIN